MKIDKSVQAARSDSDNSIVISVPRQFTDVGVVHAAVLTLGAIFVGGLMQWGFKIPALILSSVTGGEEIICFTLYPPTVKMLQRELQKAIVIAGKKET